MCVWSVFAIGGCTTISFLLRVLLCACFLLSCFFFNDTATTEIYTLSLHDALPICCPRVAARLALPTRCEPVVTDQHREGGRSEEHTSELQSLRHLVCRLLLEKKKNKNTQRKYE